MMVTGMVGEAHEELKAVDTRGGGAERAMAVATPGAAGLPRRRSRRQVLTSTAALVAAAGSSVLAACASGSASSGAGEAGKPSAQPVTIRFHSRGGAPGSQEVTLYEEQIPLFEQKYPNIKVQHEGFTGEDYTQKITVLASGGTLGDVMWTAVRDRRHRRRAARRLQEPAPAQGPDPPGVPGGHGERAARPAGVQHAHGGV